MKKVISVFLFTLLVFLTKGQSAADIDKLNGYRQFKYGDTFEKHSSYMEEQVEHKENKSKRVQELCSFDKQLLEELRLGIIFKKITLYFIDNELYKISLWTYEKEDDLRIKSDLKVSTDNHLVTSKLYELFGISTNMSNKEEGFGFMQINEVWETEINKLELQTRVKSSVYTEVSFYNKKLNQKAKLAEYE